MTSTTLIDVPNMNGPTARDTHAVKGVTSHGRHPCTPREAAPTIFTLRDGLIDGCEGCNNRLPLFCLRKRGVLAVGRESSRTPTRHSPPRGAFQMITKRAIPHPAGSNPDGQGSACPPCRKANECKVESRTQYSDPVRTCTTE